MRSLTPRQWTGIALAAVALPALTATAWPLFPFLWDLLPPGAPVGRIVLGALVVAVLAIAAALIRTQRRTSVRLWWLILAAWAVVIAAVAGMVVLIWLVLGTPGLDLPTDLSPRALDAIATRAFAVVAGLGGVALLVIAYRRQRTTEAGEEREMSKLFTDTFDSASDKLGSEHAAVRLAGVHALARLADEAPEGREDLVQMVIDVLCAYLRMPYTPAPGKLPKGATDGQAVEHHKHELEFASFRQVRHTIIRIIGNHLREDTRWRGKDYDFTGTAFDGGNLAGAHFTAGLVDFGGAEFTGEMVSFSGARFAGGSVSFSRAGFSEGKVDFFRAEFAGGTVDFGGAVFTGGTVDFSGSKFTEGKVDFSGARFAGGTVSFNDVEVSGGQMAFSRAGFSEGKVDFFRAEFAGGKVDFGGAEFTGGTVSFSGAEFTREKVSFNRAEFSGGTVSFSGAGFTGGTVSFSGAGFTRGDVDFFRARFTDGKVSFQDAFARCPLHLLEAVKSGKPGVVILPEKWRQGLGRDAPGEPF
ncbi:pentapeptide repeat-containing protein (plasmid) [Nocardiopsis flavescens]|nr:pentapeptide repeat-containing protein [Nocardiopsis flavescens]